MNHDSSQEYEYDFKADKIYEEFNENDSQESDDIIQASSESSYNNDECSSINSILDKCKKKPK